MLAPSRDGTEREDRESIDAHRQCHARFDDRRCGNGFRQGSLSDFVARLHREPIHRGALDAGRVVAIPYGTESTENTALAVFPGMTMTLTLRA